MRVAAAVLAAAAAFGAGGAAQGAVRLEKESGPAWSPDGFTTMNASGLYRRAYRLGTPRDGVDDPSCSPDGHSIAIVENRDADDGHLPVVDLRSGRARRIV